MGPISEFNIYHLMTIDDPIEPFACVVHGVEGTGECSSVDKTLGPGSGQSNSPEKTPKTNPTAPFANAPEPFRFQDNQLGHLASIIRAKNAGPYEVTFDVMFDSPDVYSAVKSSGVLTTANVAKALSIDESEVIVAMWWDPALAFKATIVRPMVSGGFGEVDMHASTQHVPLMELEIPMTAASTLTVQTKTLMTRYASNRSVQASIMVLAAALTSLAWRGKLRPLFAGFGGGSR